ncbi:hypothetical protein CALVIDRAFT_568221 [Calocera viscosa TUFC12733]|uniref:Uncharacterized protein n=1 Tax=Calocera viscosa (strain TUFC12733) TaxID=1330018 RepID=A0A167HAE0_CALVF|nr:hypothetical protein CALVIDRAFT_568221 [Calocera viscosa TUFC12733]
MAPFHSISPPKRDQRRNDDIGGETKKGRRWERRRLRKPIVVPLPTPADSRAPTTQSDEEQSVPGTGVVRRDDAIQLVDVKPALSSSSPRADVGRRLCLLCPPTEGQATWILPSDHGVIRGTSDGFLSLINTTGKASTALSVLRWRPPGPCSGLAACSGAIGTDDRNTITIVVSYEDILSVPGLQSDSAPQMVPSMTYHLALTTDGFEVLGFRTKLARTLAFDGTWSLHALYDGETDLYVRNWLSDKYASLEFAPEEPILAAEIIGRRVVVISMRRISIFSLDSLDKAAVPRGTESTMVDSIAQFSDSTGDDSVHKAWSAAVRRTPTSTLSPSSFAIVVRRDGHRIYADELFDDEGRHECRPLSCVDIQGNCFVSALGIDFECTHVMWLQHPRNSSSDGLSGGSSTLLCIPLRPEHGSIAADGVEPLVLFCDQNSMSLKHCDLVAAQRPNEAVIIGQQYSSMTFVLEGEGKSHAVDAGKNAVGLDNILTKQEGTVDEDIQTPTQQDVSTSLADRRVSWMTKRPADLEDADIQTIIKWSIAMRQSPSPSIQSGRGTRVTLARTHLPDDCVMDIAYMEQRFYAFPDGAYNALLRGFGVPGIPSLVAYCPPTQKIWAGIRCEGFDLVYGLQEGDRLGEWTVETYTVFPGDTRMLPDGPIGHKSCLFDQDRLFADHARAMDYYDAVFGNATEKDAALFRLGIRNSALPQDL